MASFSEQAIDVLKNFSCPESQDFYVAVSQLSCSLQHQRQPMPTAV